MQGPAVECVERGGKHQAVPDQFYFEVVDVETGDPMPDGREGALLVSHLNRRGTVMLRYMTGDVVAVTNEACPDCGRTEPRFLGTPYRIDGLIKVKGTLVNPSAIHERLSSYLGRGIAEYQIVATRVDPKDPFSPDTILVRAACHQDVRETMAPRIKTAVSRHVEITPEVELLPKDAFSDMDGRYKFTRFVDERQTPSPVSSPRQPSKTPPGSVGE